MIRVFAIVGSILVAIIAIQTHRLKGETKGRIAAELQRDQATAQIEAEQQARAHEQRIAKEASDGFQSTVTALQNELASRPIGPVIVRVPVRASVPEAGSAARTTSRPDAETEGRVVTEVEVDIAPGLTAYAMDCQFNSAQLDALQSWVRSR